MSQIKKKNCLSGSTKLISVLKYLNLIQLYLIDLNTCIIC